MRLELASEDERVDVASEGMLVGHVLLGVEADRPESDVAEGERQDEDDGDGEDDPQKLRRRVRRRARTAGRNCRKGQTEDKWCG